MEQLDLADMHLVDEVRRLLVLAGTEQAAAEAAFDVLARRVHPSALSTAVATVTREYLAEPWWSHQERP